MARRRNAIAHRFARIKGLPPEEKALMQRIGHLIDSALNNRQASNPYEQSQQRVNRQVYPPTGLLTQTGMSSVKILWDATPSNELLRYEVQFTNLTTGVDETKTTFTNEIIYKGANGSYIARIKSVGRDNSSSEIRRVTFALGDEAMLIEGAKNGATELGTLVQDNIELREGYSVYVWGSCVLDKYMLDTNNAIVFKLWRADKADASFGEAYLVETATLYPGTESGTNLDSTARAGLITRPAGNRVGSYETSQSVMFSPQQVDPDDDELTVTFFLQAVNREVEDDEVCLSLVMWSGADGIGSAVPGDPHVPDAPYIFPHFNSFHKQGSPTGEWQFDFPYDTRSWCANIEDGYSLIGNKWTIGMWVRFDSLDAVKMSGNAEDEEDSDYGDQVIFSRDTIDLSGNGNSTPNQIRILLTGTKHDGEPPFPAYKHNIIVELWDPTGLGANSREIRYPATTSGLRNEISAIFPWGDAQTGAGALYNDAWYFMVFCFEGGNYVNANVPKLRTYINAGVDVLTGEPIMTLMVPFSDLSTQPIIQDDTGSLSYQYELPADSLSAGKYYKGIFNGDLNQAKVTGGMQWYQLGIWNRALDSAVSGSASTISEIEALFNEGRGWAIDWRRNTTQYESPFISLNYSSAENLVHLCQMGAVEQPFSTHQAGRDTGYHLPDWEGELNWTYDRGEQGYEWREPSGANYHQRLIEGVWYDNLPQSWNRGTDIYDVLSPLGTNGTTQYDYAYPGQNMTGAGTAEHKDDGAADRTPPQRVSAPYSPGYHPDDSDRPIKGGV